MLFWARKEATKHMVRVHADGTEQCFVSFGSDTVSTWMFWMEEREKLNVRNVPLEKRRRLDESSGARQKKQSSIIVDYSRPSVQWRIQEFRKGGGREGN